MKTIPYKTLLRFCEDRREEYRRAAFSSPFIRNDHVLATDGRVGIMAALKDCGNLPELPSKGPFPNLEELIDRAFAVTDWEWHDLDEFPMTTEPRFEECQYCQNGYYREEVCDVCWGTGWKKNIHKYRFRLRNRQEATFDLHLIDILKTMPGTTRIGLKPIGPGFEENIRPVEFQNARGIIMPMRSN